MIFVFLLKLTPWFYIFNSSQSFGSNETCPSSPVLHAPPFWYRAPTLRVRVARGTPCKMSLDGVLDIESSSHYWGRSILDWKQNQRGTLNQKSSRFCVFFFPFSSRKAIPIKCWDSFRFPQFMSYTNSECCHAFGVDGMWELWKHEIRQVE